MYKYNIGDFPLKDYPCEYWWVRYAVSCTYLKQQFDKLWDPILEELMKKHNIMTYSSKGRFNFLTIRSEKQIKYLINHEIFITFKDKTKKVLNEGTLDNEKDKEIWNVLSEHLADQEMIQWNSCPYQNDKQSKCPFYKPSKYYKDIPLGELRKRKGYEI